MLTDDQLLVTILGPKTGVPPLAAARIQRWSLILAAYQYEIEYRKSAEHANADAISRLVQASLEDKEEEEEVYLISYLEELLVTARDIAAATRKDPVCTERTIRQLLLAYGPLRIVRTVTHCALMS